MENWGKINDKPESWVINQSCKKYLNYTKDNTIDLVITSPPYNVDLGNNKFNKNPYDMYNDNKEHKDYLNWLKDIFKLIYKKMKPGGRVAINIGDQKNGAISTHSDIIQFMVHELNYILMTTLVWDKHHVNSRTSWGSYGSPSCPSFPKPFEFILIFAKENKKLQEKGETDLTKEEFKKWAFGMWSVAPEGNAKKIGHPAPFSVEIPYRLIKMLSWKDSLVVDPFCGSGTTGVAAMQLGRKFVGMDISEKYCEIAKSRIEAAIPIDIFEEENENNTSRE